MTIDLSAILPNVAQTLDGTGFLFGAGTSREAGYPMMPQLTREVIGALNSTERSVLDEVLNLAEETYDDAKATPNIEQLSDLVIAHWTNSGDPRFSGLENRLRELILARILAVSSPTLDNHCRFFEALKRRAFGLPCSVWIFTTNYDLLFETAAARVGVTRPRSRSYCLSASSLLSRFRETWCSIPLPEAARRLSRLNCLGVMPSE